MSTREPQSSIPEPQVTGRVSTCAGLGRDRLCRPGASPLSRLSAIDSGLPGKSVLKIASLS